MKRHLSSSFLNYLNGRLEMIRQEIAEQHGDDLLFLSEEYFDGAIVGVTNYGRVVYDMGEMVDILCEEEGWITREAVEYLEFNTWCAYVGDHTPIFVDMRD